jgi:acylphosphatase
MKRLQARLIVAGRVQGVFYRHSTRQAARDLGLSGWVKNLEDGSVEIFADGPESAVKKLIEWCHKGPPNAVVNNVSVEWENDGTFQATTDGVFEIV